MHKEFIVYVKMSRPNKLSTGVLSAMMAKSGQTNSLKTIALSGRDHSSIVFYETRKSKRQAIQRERELKQLNRKRLTELVRSVNPEMLDISGIWREDEIHFDRNSIFMD